MKQKFNESEIISFFKQENPKKTVFGNYRIEGDKLFYRAQSSEEVPRLSDAEEFSKWKKETGKQIRDLDGKLVERETGKTVLLEALTKDSKWTKYAIQYYETNFIAQKIKIGETETIFLGNLQVLPLIGRTVAYGRENRNDSETEIQKVMKVSGFNMILLSQFENSDFSTFEKLELTPPLLVHYEVEAPYNRYNARRDEKISKSAKVSGLLFKLENKVYLSDVDRPQAEKGFLNFFLTEVHREARTIEGAYESMKPKEVVDAEKKGLETKRLGKLWLIATEAPTIPELTIDERLILLADKVGYGVTPKVLEYISGKSVSEFTKKGDKVLEKVPQAVKLGLGRGFSIETGITLKGLTFVTGKIESPGRKTLNLKQWYILVTPKKLELEREAA